MALRAPSAASASRRSAGLDAARALAVVAMVVGHTADSLLAARYRDTALFITYSTFRGMTAPLFLFVSGWAVATRATVQGLFGRAVVSTHVLRAGVLVGWALLLRWPAWDWTGLLKGHVEPWRHWLGMDALLCIALCLVLSGLALAPRARRLVRFALLAALATAAVGLARAASEHPPGWGFSAWLVMSATSPFPLLPWAGHFFAGAAAGVLLASTRSREAQALGLLLPGFLGLALTWALGLDHLPLWSPTLFLYRLSFAVSAGGVMVALPERWTRPWAAVGQAALLIYVLHLPVLYGWGTFPGLQGAVGPALTPLAVLSLAALLVGVGTGISRGWRRHRRGRSGLPDASAWQARGKLNGAGNP